MLRTILSGQTNFTDILIYIISVLAVVFLTLPVHEFAHAFVAVKLGDNTPRYQGRLTLNPFAHIDYLGALCIMFVGFGWAKPVQVNHRNFDNPKLGMAMTALAGPVSNLIMALLGFILYNVFYLLAVNVNMVFSYFAFFVYYIATINISLAVFNLIPVPPLDGSRILTAVLPDKYYYILMGYEKYFFWILLGLLWTGVISVPLSNLSSVISDGLQYIAYLPFSSLF